MQTKQALAGALKKLLEKRSLDKITVRDIVDSCGVNRQTFYYHFHNIYELMEWIIQNDADQILAETVDYSDWKKGIASVMTYLRKNRNLILNAYNSVSHEAVSEYLKRLLRPYVLQVVENEAKDLSIPPCQEDIAFVVDIYTLAVVGILMEWIGRRMEVRGTEDRFQKLFAATDGSFSFMLNNLERKRREKEIL